MIDVVPVIQKELALMHTKTTHNPIFLSLLAPAVLFLGACGGSDTGASDQVGAQNSANDQEQEFATSSTENAGGGTLIFDGTSYPIDYVFCALGPPVQVAAVAEGYKIAIEGTVKQPSVYIFTRGSQNWVSTNKQFTVAGSLVTSSASRYVSNHAEGDREASFEIQCP